MYSRKVPAGCFELLLWDQDPVLPDAAGALWRWLRGPTYIPPTVPLRMHQALFESSWGVADTEWVYAISTCSILWSLTAVYGPLLVHLILVPPFPKVPKPLR